MLRPFAWVFNVRPSCFSKVLNIVGAQNFVPTLFACRVDIQTLVVGNFLSQSGVCLCQYFCSCCCIRKCVCVYNSRSKTLNLQIALYRCKADKMLKCNIYAIITELYVY